MSEWDELPASRRRAIIIAATALAAVVVVGLWLAYRPVAVPLQGMIDTEQINVATKLPSRVERLLVREGEQVMAGQPLVTLSSPELDARQQQAKGLLEGAEAVEAMAQTGARAEDVESIRSVWQSAQAAAELAEKSFMRADNLFRAGVISAQRRDEVLALKQSSAAQAEAARQQYLKTQRGTRPEEKTVAAAQVQVAKAAMAEAQSLRTETQLIAPVSGEVSKRLANEGELVAPGVPIYTLVDLKDVWAVMSVREDQFHGLKTGQTLHGVVPALDDRHIDFRIDFISPQGDFATWRATRQSKGYDVRSFEVRARPVDAVEGLRPGMSVLFDWPQ